MVQLSVDTDKDSPQMIAKIIEMLHAHLNSSSSTQVSSTINQHSLQNTYSHSSYLPSSAPVSNQLVNSEPSMFDIFGAEDRPNVQQSQPLPSSTPSQDANPFSIFDEPVKSTTQSNSVAGYADDDLFNAFSNDLPSTSPNFQNNVGSSQLGGLESSFKSAQSLLDDNFNPIEQEEVKEEPKKSANFFNFEQY